VGRLLFQLRQYFAGRGDFNASKDFPIRLIFSGRKDFPIRLIFSGRKDFPIRLIFLAASISTYFPAFYFSAFFIKYAPIFNWRNCFRPLGLRLIFLVMIIYCIL
jgi:hypothetical protein